MQTFLIALGAFLFIMSIMAIGVIMGRKPIAGSCGGIGAALGEKDYVCDICGDDPAKCEERSNPQPESRSAAQATAEKPASFYDASGAGSRD